MGRDDNAGRSTLKTHTYLVLAHRLYQALGTHCLQQRYRQNLRVWSRNTTPSSISVRFPVRALHPSAPARPLLVCKLLPADRGRTKHARREKVLLQGVVLGGEQGRKPADTGKETGSRCSQGLVSQGMRLEIIQSTGIRTLLVQALTYRCAEGSLDLYR